MGYPWKVFVWTYLLESWVAPFVIKYPLSSLFYILWYTFIVRGFLKGLFSSVQLLSRLWLFATPRAAAHQSSLSITNWWISCPSTQWCHPTILSSVLSFSSHLQSFPASRSFPINQFFASDDQNTGVSASTSVFAMNTLDWFPLGWTCWIFLQSKGLSRVFSNTTVQKHKFFSSLFSLILTSIHNYWKNHSFD